MVKMPSIAVRIGRIQLKNPVMTAAGTAGYGPEWRDFDPDGQFLNGLKGFITKGVSLLPWQGNPMPRMVETPWGVLNAIGLQNPGVKAFIEKKLPFLRRNFPDLPVIVNVAGKSVEEYVQVVQILDSAEGISGYEINISCPNTKEGIMFGATPEAAAEVVRAVRSQTELTIITKLSPNVGDIVPIARAAVEAGSDAISLINTLRATDIDVETGEYVLANVTGGLSGPAIRPVALEMVREVANKKLGVPIIGMGGIMNAVDALKFILAGANAVAIGTGTFDDPGIPARVVEGIKEYLMRKNTPDVNKLVGTARIRT